MDVTFYGETGHGTVIYTHDEKGKREDVHRPSAINPGDYTYLRVDYKRKHPVTGGPAGTCHHCGKAIVWEVYFQHTSGLVVTFGETCAHILGLSDNRVDHEMVLLKRTAANERIKYMREMENSERREMFEAQYPQLVAFFTEMDTEGESLYFLVSLKQSLDQWGSLTPRQADAALKVLSKREEEMLRKLNAPLEVEPDEALNENDGKRYTLKGTIMSEKWQASQYKHTKEHKMLVKLDDGNKVYGSMPIEIERHVDEKRCEYKGLRIQFDATVKRSDKDDHFGFINRPTKAKVIG